MADASAAEVGTSNNVYIKSKEHAWVPARVIETNEDEATVSIPQYKDEQSIQSDGGKASTGSARETIKLNNYPSKALPLQNVDEHGMLKQVEDMVDLSFLHEAAILYNLKARHVKGKPYTRTGDIVVAVNPYKWMHELYSQDVRNNYANTLVWDSTAGEEDPRSKIEPHVYETSSLSYRGLAVDGQNQSILVSGESGAGKTETVKILMSHIASIQSHGADDVSTTSTSRSLEKAFANSPIVKRVLDSNPLLEAFGNAKTVRNDNSSRFGKFIQLQFDAEDPTHAAFAGKRIPSCVLAGSKSEVYLLEKSRVVGHEEEERTYHVFYQLLAAPEEVKAEFWEGLEDTDNESFSYVGWTDTDVIEGKDDGARFQLTVDALTLVGVDGEKLRTLMRAICIVLQLGNLMFDADGEDEEKSAITSEEELQQLAELMGVEQVDIKGALTQRTVRARNEEYKVPLRAVQAKDSCDAFAKEIYAKTFLWLVRTINSATCAKNNYDGKTGDYAVIGLLDIFGFESFETNRFEQLCINYANEKLQQKFTQDIFRSVQAEYEEEGIELGEIKYEDNVDVLRLVEGRMGVIAVLNEECVRPKGNDSAFVSKVQAMNKESECLIAEKSFRDYEFGIKHYAGPVVYDATNFVTKNMDNLPKDLLECAHKCSNSIVREALTNDSVMETPPKKARKRPKQSTAPNRALTRKGSTLVQESVLGKFRNQLNALMLSLTDTRTRYIRCIKPNTEKKPKLMQHLSTVEQLRCAGVVAAVTISRSAFPNRLEHVVVLQRFKSLWKKGHNSVDTTDTSSSSHDTQRRIVEELLTTALRSLEVRKDGQVVKAFVIGKSRAYFRTGALEQLEADRLKGLSTWAVEIQRAVRCFLACFRYNKLRKAAIVAETATRKFLARKRYVEMKTACIAIQCWTRCVEAKRELVRRRRNRMASMIQAHWRMTVARAIFKKHRLGAVAIQAIARGAIQRPKYQEALIEKREEAKLENQLKALQRKLEEAEAKRVQAEKDAEARIVEAKKEAEKRSVASETNASKNQGTEEVPQVAAVTSTTEAPKVAVAGQLTEQQQNLMDESGKMLEYLRKEVFKLRNQNSQLRTDFDLLKENNQRLMDANASAGASFAALNKHAKQMSKTNQRLISDLQSHKQQIHKLNLTHVELKEELKLKQATYVAEVQTRLQYQKTMNKIVDVIQERCRDTRLVEEVLSLTDECEGTSEYLNGQPTNDSIYATPMTPSMSSPARMSITGAFKSFFS